MAEGSAGHDGAGTLSPNAAFDDVQDALCGCKERVDHALAGVEKYAGEIFDGTHGNLLVLDADHGGPGMEKLFSSTPAQWFTRPAMRSY